jgi:type IX secretion system substrate protein
MKKILTGILLLLLCCAVNMHAQILDLTPPSLQLQSVTTTMQAHLASADTMEGGGLDHLNYFKALWGGRVYANDSASGHDMFSAYFHGLREAMEARMSGGMACGSGWQGNWQAFGPDSLPGDQKIGKIDAIWADTGNLGYILAGATGGLFKTTDTGHNWHCITDNALINGGVTGIGGIAVNPLNNNTIFLGTYVYEEGSVSFAVFSDSFYNYLTLGAGILESFDGGNTWGQEFIPTGSGYWHDTVEGVQKVFFSPDSGRLYAFIGNQVYTRNNRPDSAWVNITPPFSSFYAAWMDMQFVPGDPNHFFISDLNGGPYATVVESHVAEPGPSDWETISLTLPTTIIGTDTITDSGYCRFAISVPNSDTLYVAGMGTNESGQDVAIFKYNISGGTHNWTLLNKNVPNHGYKYPSILKMNLVVSPNNPANIYYGGDIPSQSVDYGNTFIAIGDYSASNNHADVRGFSLQKSTNTAHGVSDILIIANDGGVGKKPAGNDVTTLGTNTVTNANGNGLACGQFWGFDMSEDGTLMVGGMQHDGIMSYESDKDTCWKDLLDATDAGSAGFDNVSKKGLVFEGGNPYLAIPAGTRELGASSGDGSIPDGQVGFHESVYIDPSGNEYVGMHYLWEMISGTWIDKGATFGLSNPDTAYIREMTFSPYYTDLTGYVLYNYNEGSQHFEYRNPATLGVSTFLPVTGMLGHLPNYVMNCVAMDPNHPEKVWVGMSGFGTDTLQVQYSPDAGGSWYNVSYGLPMHVPVGKIIYQEGSTDVVFCSTDVGIYRCDFSGFNPSVYNYGIQWTCFNNCAIPGTGFPNAWVTDLKINYCQSKLYAATYGRGIWSTDLFGPGDAPPQTDTITGIVNWGSDHYISGGIYLKPGAQLTISGCTVHMPKNGEIYVDRNAHLIVDGSTITNDCAQCFWQGIVLYGNSSAAQAPTSNQGWATIKNGSIIQHAKTGITNYVDSTGNTGGIIQVASSSFINNHMAVDMQPYLSYIPGTSTLLPDLSYFSNCTFALDTNYKGDGLSYPMNYMVNLSEVNGVKFTGCQFLNRDYHYQQYLGGEGIHAINSGFSVTPYCPISYVSLCSSPVRSRFSGLTTGVDVQGILGPDLTVTIDRADFDSAALGVYVSTHDHVSTTRCNFAIGHGETLQDSVLGTFSGTCFQNVGIFIQNTQQFNMEGNNFMGKPPTYSGVYTFGTVIANLYTGKVKLLGYPVSNNVYLNSFDSLSLGVYSIGDNTDDGMPWDGLHVSCNTFYKNNYDLLIDSTGASAGFDGISPWQDYLGVSAGNTFSGSAKNILNYGISSGKPSVLFYYYSGGTGYKPTATAGPVALVAATSANSCISSFSGLPGGGVGYSLALNSTDLDAHRHSFHESQATFQGTLASYNSLMDFGNTDSLVHIIDITTGTVLYGILSSGAPYISETALEEVANDVALPYSSMVNIMLQNPDDLRDSLFVAYMNNAYSFSTADLASIYSAAGTTTSRTILENTLGTTAMSMSRDANIVMMALKSPVDTNVSVYDTTGAGICTDTNSVYYMLDSNAAYVGLDSVDSWLQSMGGLWTYYARAGFYNGLGQISVADSILSGMNSLIPTSDTEDRAIYSSYTTLWDVIKGAEEDGRNVFELNTGELATLDTSGMPVYTPNSAVVIMRSVHILPGGGYPVLPTPCLSLSRYDGRKSHGETNPTRAVFRPIVDINENGNNRFSAFPNPTSGVVTFAYNVQDGSSGISIAITNVVGEQIAVLQQGNTSGEAYWDSKYVQPGIYIYTASDEKGIVSKGKLVVVR